LDRRLLIENWSDHPPTEDHATVELTAGGPAELKLEYYQGAGNATARLKWTRPDGTAEVIPTERFRQPDGGGPGLRAEYFENRAFDAPRTVRVDPAIDFDWPPAPRPIPRKATAVAAEIGLDLPAGLYRVEWVDPRTGIAVSEATLEHTGGRKSLSVPAFDDDIALAVRAR
jgi:hypothetical protein